MGPVEKPDTGPEFLQTSLLRRRKNWKRVAYRKAPFYGCAIMLASGHKPIADRRNTQRAF
jgi:hypothetical protein